MASCWGWAFYFVLCVQSIAALEFRVGGYKGWSLPSGSESYNQWAGNNRFQIGDTLLFKYHQKVDSVLQVSPQNYNTCNTTSPIKSFKDGNTVFKLDRNGAFYFISGNSSKCQKGERLIVVVMAPCHSNHGGNCRHSSSPSPSPSPSPRISSSSSPSPSPRISSSPSPSPKLTPKSPPSLSPQPSKSPSPSVSPVESPQIITPSSSSNSPITAPAALRSASSSSSTSLPNLLIPFLLLALLKPNL